MKNYRYLKKFLLFPRITFEDGRPKLWWLRTVWLTQRYQEKAQPWGPPLTGWVTISIDAELG